METFAAMPLHPYQLWAGDDPGEGALLVFAHSARGAKKIGFSDVQGWTDCDWIDLRVVRLRKHVDYLRSLACPVRLAADLGHVVDDPETCSVCETWGAPPLASGTGCAYCEEVWFDPADEARA